MPTTTVPPNIADHVSIVRVSKAENPIEIRKVPTEQATDDVDDIKTVVQPSKVKVQRVKKVSSKTQENNFEAISLQELGLSSISAFTNAEVTVTKLPRHSTVEAQLNQIIDNKVHDTEELEEELGVPTADSDDNKESATVDDIKENAFRNIDGLDDNLQSNQQLDMKTDLSVNGLNDRIKRTNEIYETAKEGQKRQADEFLQIASKKQKLINLNVGDNVLVSIAEIDRGPTGLRNVLALIIELKYDKYKLGTEEGVLAGYYSFHQISKAPRAATLLVSHVTQCEPKSLREIVKLQSITGCQGLLKCSCKGRCKTKRCK
ncbi:unnamed protein product [Rotaria sp. Silwood1]|nr:unnamed protein product [Rotaria sp. Silwood1]